jgi:LTXXQ motif family protein
MRRITKTSRWKLAGSVGAIMLCAAAGTALAAKPGGGGGGAHPAGGGHPGGGVPHFSAPHAAAPHFSAARGGASHFSVAHAHAHFAPHISASHATRFASPSFRGRGGRASRTAHVTPHITPSGVHSLATTARPLATGTHAPFARAAFHADPAAFAAHRHFAGDPAFRPFWGYGWHPYHHLGWIGPLFWPYAYGDIFYYALWPDDYYDVDPFWAYGYGDVYEAIFSPYSYDDYVQGPGAPARMASLTQAMAQSCSDEAAEVTGWPIDQIQSAVQPNPQQTALLDDLGNAIVEASHDIKMHCPTSVSFTPTARLNEMQQRLQTLLDAVNTVSPPLGKFYDSLGDEQKARFNGIAPPAAQHAQAPQGGDASQAQQTDPKAQCNASVMSWPADQIDRVVKPDDAQRAKLGALQSAAAQAADAIKAACPTEVPATPPGRLAAVGKRLQAMLQAIEAVQPALADFYNALSDDQKARFNAMGKQLFAENNQ